MKFAMTLLALLFSFSGTLAFADIEAPVCFTLNRPNKWEAGLVLNISTNADGTIQGTLVAITMFRRTTNQSPNLNYTLDTVYDLKKTKDASGAVTYEGGLDRTLKVVIGAPDPSGNTYASVDLHMPGFDLHSTDASPTRFGGDRRCD